MSRTRTRLGLATGAVVSALAIGCLPASAFAVPETATTSAVAQGETARRIPLQGAINVRDLGGYRTYGGQEVRYGQVYRADALSKLTDSDVAALARLGLAKVVDFRVAAEIQYDGADRLPAGLTPTSRPVTDNGLFARLMTAIGSRDPVRQEELLGDGRAAAFMRDVYRTFVTSPENRARFAETLRDIADSDRRSPLLYHCTAGKDRTGWTSYVLLRALGVPSRTAERDYLASNTYRAAHDAKVRDGLKQSGMMQNPDLLIPLQEVRLEYLDAALERMKAEYGGFDRYLTQGLGLDRRTLAKLRAGLLRH
ncbi:protein-tyrosine-phosphatase [Streptomyces agglomeratus]|uniref:Protein-tyrosine-phosphatase n=1 Tax=Streptomyces agglomeratus TaxID=285458 RepID=A0A1E5PCV3_9ACTN|nr:tyrosine-protein phosphatase [Streptomyces agglomeratus]OEJ27356.1 protein-tyrosine-phosphatase [Streptomyces agglomeratus]OEJ38588.1 protein-tyrosine-phosphatase [Streptomyces agglomeratus]OEJ47027.1 protein-tyrosine-phosphatase [Streptomyces agglomeratus]OEJ51117.1 protein-tyrosine-phosphatase [Streptomyces agglomeratus]OEJ58485.1 protein-tyrosine-phosphatase [Streptomyces agglomeratus]